MKTHLSTLILLCSFVYSFGQIPEGIGYQALVRDGAGVIVSSGTVDVEIGILATAVSGTLLYEESHSLTTNSQGLMELNIGEGTTTGAGLFSTLSSIDWSADIHFLNVKIDVGASGTFTDIGTSQLMAVPYAFHSKTSDQSYSLNDLEDVDTAGIQVGHTLTWNGSTWVSSNIDSVDYAVNSSHSNYSDTTLYSYASASLVADTAQFSYYADSSNYSAISASSAQSDSSYYADTAGFALNCLNSWGLNGNALTGTEFIGSTNAEDVVVVTNSIERMRITSAGKIGINTGTPVADFELVGDNGMILQGALGSGVTQTFTGDRLVWYPKKAHFYAGGGSINLSDGVIGDYSFGQGYNVTVSGDYSTAFGNASVASGEASFAIGLDSKATGDYSFAQGQNSNVSGVAAVGMGRQAISSGLASVALGYHPWATADYAVAIGNNCHATAENAFAMGYRAKANHAGSFVISDQSGAALFSSADNQFMGRFVGGSYFYSAADLSTGVVLSGGSGAWATVSDSTKKENINDLNYEEILQEIMMLDIYEWNYLTQDSSVRHIGPMAQDFYAAFGFGESDTTITTTDIDGVNMAGLKALYEKSLKLEQIALKYAELEKKYAELREQRDSIYIRLEMIERNILEDSAKAD